ncbi:ead/Ea22-like family protein [Salmonella enterica]|nr:ead/Ea22-like family protein [Salmonella enterica]
MTIDKRALREVAEKATKGPWTLFSDIDTKTFSIHTPRDKRCENVIKWGGFDCQKNAKANAEFIAAFNPKVALALLDENIQLQREKDALEAVALALRDDMRDARGKLEAAERLIAELDQRLIEYAGIATREARRVAELEARKVNLSKLSVGEVMHMSGFSRDYAEGWCAGNDNAIHEIRTAGIKVKES